MKKRYEEARANMKGKMSNCLVVAVVLLAVSALSGAVICVQGNDYPPGPEPNKIEVTVEPSSIMADGASVAIITARAMKDDEPSNNRTLTFKIISEPREGNALLTSSDQDDPNEGKVVVNVTNDGGYAYATLKAGTMVGDVKIEVYRVLSGYNVSATAVVTLKEQGQTDLFNMSIVEGWNLISIPLELDNTSINAVFPDASDGDVLYAYDGGWIRTKYYSGYGWDGDLETVEPDKGYWYGANAAYIATIEGTKAGSRSVPITTGWNLVGYTRLNETGIDDLIQNVSDGDVLYAYAEGWIRTKYYSGYGWDGDLTTMQPGKGYWYGANEQFTWTY